jgi:hypothetical protein
MLCATKALSTCETLQISHWKQPFADQFCKPMRLGLTVDVKNYTASQLQSNFFKLVYITAT